MNQSRFEQVRRLKERLLQEDEINKIPNRSESIEKRFIQALENMGGGGEINVKSIEK